MNISKLYWSPVSLLSRFDPIILDFNINLCSLLIILPTVQVCLLRLWTVEKTLLHGKQVLRDECALTFKTIKEHMIGFFKKKATNLLKYRTLCWLKKVVDTRWFLTWTDTVCMRMTSLPLLVFPTGVLPSSAAWPVFAGSFDLLIRSNSALRKMCDILRYESFLNVHISYLRIS